MNYKVLLTLCIPFASWAAADYTEQDAMRVQAVKTYIDNVLQEGRSQIKTTPLLADGINTTTRKPVEWIYPDGRTATISNFANQQNFLRTLTAMSVVTEDQRYQLEAVRITRYFMDNFIADNGLFYWGGHRFVNLDTLELEGPQNKNSVHELKNHYPYYPFLYHVDPHATERYIKAFWQAHVEDWQSLDMGRHGSYSKNYDDKVFHRPIPASLVDQSKLPIMPETKGLTFCGIRFDLCRLPARLAGTTSKCARISRLGPISDDTVQTGQAPQNGRTGLSVHFPQKTRVATTIRQRHQFKIR